MSLPDDVPGGWIDLDLVFAQSDEDSVVLDCVVSRVRQLRAGQPPARLQLGWPIALRIHTPVGNDERRELEAWLDQDPELTVLTDDQGCLLLLSVDQRTVALELHAR